MASSRRMAWVLATVSTAVALQVSASQPVEAKSMSANFHPFRSVRFRPDFQLQDPALGEVRPPLPVPGTASLSGSSIAAFAGDIVVIDEDSGQLIRAHADHAKVASLDIGAEASQLVVDGARARAYVADRKGDRVVVVDLSTPDALTEIDAWRTDAEPFGLALSADGASLLVTAVADASLSAYATESGRRRWRVSVADEPRGVSFSPDGAQALVTFLTTGAVARVSIGVDDARVEYQALDPANSPVPSRGGLGLRAIEPSEEQGRTFARNAFSATFIGHGIAVVPHQLSTPQLATRGRPVASSGYGGGSGFESPVSHRIAFLEAEGDGTMPAAFAATNLHQPRAATYDPASDTLYVAGYGSDDVLALVNASQVSIRHRYRVRLATGCGPTGLAVDPSTGDVLAFCSLSRSVSRIRHETDTSMSPTVVPGPELASSRLSAEAQRGREVFRRGNSVKLSAAGAMACSSCHAEARADGLSWFLQGKTLQTPLLAGRLEGAHPFKWDGKDPNLRASLSNTVRRLGGSGLTGREIRDLRVFLETLEPPRPPTPDDAEAVARGKQLFESEATGCAECHYGPLLTDNRRHEMAADLPRVDTPSLIGLAHSAPYYHDGSAQTLVALLEGKGKIHGMGRTSRLSDRDVDDLASYLETL